MEWLPTRLANNYARRTALSSDTFVFVHRVPAQAGRFAASIVHLLDSAVRQLSPIMARISGKDKGHRGTLVPSLCEQIQSTSEACSQ